MLGNNPHHTILWSSPQVSKYTRIDSDYDWFRDSSISFNRQSKYKKKKLAQKASKHHPMKLKKTWPGGGGGTERSILVSPTDNLCQEQSVYIPLIFFPLEAAQKVLQDDDKF